MFDRLLDTILQFIDLFKFWVVLDPYEAGVLLRLGRFIRVLEPGFHWLIPFGVDRYLHEHTVPRTHSLMPQSVTLTDGKQVGFEAVITYNVRDIKVALLEVEDSEHAIQDSCAGTIAHTVAKCTWQEIVDTTEWENRVLKACRLRGFKFGLEITGVQFSTMALIRTIRLMQH